MTKEELINARSRFRTRIKETTDALNSEWENAQQKFIEQNTFIRPGQLYQYVGKAWVGEKFTKIKRVRVEFNKDDAFIVVEINRITESGRVVFATDFLAHDSHLYIKEEDLIKE